MGEEGGGIGDRARLGAGRGVAQVAVIAAIVTTLLACPVGLALVLALALLSIPLEAVVTFGGVVGIPVGLALWWLLAFTGTFVCAACLFPWRDKVLEWPKRS